MLTADWLLEHAWGGEPPASGLRALRFHISRLRRELGNGLIETRPGGYRLAISSEQVDALVVEAKAMTARRESDRNLAADLLAEVLGMWRGAPFVDAAPCASLDHEAGRLSELHLTITEDRFQAQLDAGAGRDLVAELLRVTTQHPLRESLWLMLITAQYRAGLQPDALRSYEQMRAMLADSLGLNPSSELRDLQRRVLQQDPSLLGDVATESDANSVHARSRAGPGSRDNLPTSATRMREVSNRYRELFPPSLELVAGSGRLIGRGDAMKQLRDAWSRVLEGQSMVTIVTGEAGVGKTRLVAELAREIHGGGGAVLLGSCFEDAQAPYQPFSQAIGSTFEGLSDTELETRMGTDARTLRVLLPSSVNRTQNQIVDASAERAELLAAVHRYFLNLAQAVPTLLVVEDLHWATATTRDVLLHIARAGGRAPLLVVATSRDAAPDVTDELSTLLGVVARQSNTNRISLGGLDDEGVHELIGAVVGESEAVDSGVIREQTGGNPLFVREMLLEGYSPATIGTSVQGLLLLRSHRLTRDDNLMLDLAATIGAEFDADLLSTAAEVPIVDVLEMLDRADRAGLTVGTPGRTERFSFVHALFRSVRYNSVPASRLLRLHHRVAEALDHMYGATDAVASDLARHACAALPLGDVRVAIGYALRAGDLAMESLALVEAANHFRCALDIADRLRPPDENLCCRITARLGELLLEADDEKARTLLQQAADQAHHLHDYELLASIIWLLGPQGVAPGRHEPQLVALAREALQGVGDAPSSARARLLIVLASHDADEQTPDHRVLLIDEALAAARSAGDPVALGQVLSRYQGTGWHPDNLEQRIAAANELAGLANRLSQPIFRIVAHESCCSNWLEAGELAAAFTEATAIEELLSNRTDSLGQLGIHERRATRHFLAGDLDAAERTAEQVLSIGSAVASARGTDSVAYGYGPHIIVIRFNQGRIAEMIPLIEAAADSSPELDAYQAALAMARARSGDLEAARTVVTRLVAGNLAGLRRHAQWYSAMVCLADAAELIGDSHMAHLLADHLHRYSGRLAVHGGGVSQPIDLALAQLALTFDDLRLADEKAAATIEFSRHNDTPIFLGRALLQQAVVRSRLLQPARRFRPLVDEALAISQRTGAHLIAQDARRYQLD